MGGRLRVEYAAKSHHKLEESTLLAYGHGAKQHSTVAERVLNCYDCPPGPAVFFAFLATSEMPDCMAGGRSYNDCLEHNSDLG